MPRITPAVRGRLANLGVELNGGVEGSGDGGCGEGGAEEVVPGGTTVSAAEGGPSGGGPLRQDVRLTEKVLESAQPPETAGALGNPCISAINLAPLRGGDAPNFDPTGSADRGCGTAGADAVIC